MADVRLIVQSSKNGEEEYVIFTDAFDTPVEDFIIGDCSISTDTIIDIELPSGFPFNYMLKRTNL